MASLPRQRLPAPPAVIFAFTDIRAPPATIPLALTDIVLPRIRHCESTPLREDSFSRENTPTPTPTPPAQPTASGSGDTDYSANHWQNLPPKTLKQISKRQGINVSDVVEVFNVIYPELDEVERTKKYEGFREHLRVLADEWLDPSKACSFQDGADMKRLVDLVRSFQVLHFPLLNNNKKMTGAFPWLSHCDDCWPVKNVLQMTLCNSSKNKRKMEESNALKRVIGASVSRGGRSAPSKNIRPTQKTGD
uniref:Uncharacterized protein n=1 Tax=Mycena chlorophos TaxID=658473 RepID=A0ABQ0KZM1_MYCCL|nr:predicted protein [Mycena chlorophos]